MSETSRGPDRRQFIALGLDPFVVASVRSRRAGASASSGALPLMGTIAEIAVVESDVRRQSRDRRRDGGAGRRRAHHVALLSDI